MKHDNSNGEISAKAEVHTYAREATSRAEGHGGSHAQTIGDIVESPHMYLDPDSSDNGDEYGITEVPSDPGYSPVLLTSDVVDDTGPRPSLIESQADGKPYRISDLVQAEDRSPSLWADGVTDGSPASLDADSSDAGESYRLTDVLSDPGYSPTLLAKDVVDDPAAISSCTKARADGKPYRISDLIQAEDRSASLWADDVADGSPASLDADSSDAGESYRLTDVASDPGYSPALLATDAVDDPSAISNHTKARADGKPYRISDLIQAEDRSALSWTDGVADGSSTSPGTGSSDFGKSYRLADVSNDPCYPSTLLPKDVVDDPTFLSSHIISSDTDVAYRLTAFARDSDVLPSPSANSISNDPAISTSSASDDPSYSRTSLAKNVADDPASLSRHTGTSDGVITYRLTNFVRDLDLPPSPPANDIADGLAVFLDMGSDNGEEYKLTDVLSDPGYSPELRGNNIAEDLAVSPDADSDSGEEYKLTDDPNDPGYSLTFPSDGVAVDFTPHSSHIGLPDDGTPSRLSLSPVPPANNSTMLFLDWISPEARARLQRLRATRRNRNSITSNEDTLSLLMKTQHILIRIRNGQGVLSC